MTTAEEKPEPDSPDDDGTLRLGRFLARAGVASRRASTEVIRAGRVSVNGAVVVDLSHRVDPTTDRVEVDGRLVELAAAPLTLAFHKPKGVLVSRGDTHGRKTVFDMLPIEFARDASRLTYIGRLDLESEGLLLLSTDGDLVNRLTHPSKHVEKEYLVWLDSPLGALGEEHLRTGVELADGFTSPCQVKRQPRLGAAVYSMTLHEGKNRQIRRMAEAAGRRVRRLVRIRVGGLALADLAEGQWRRLSDREIHRSFTTSPNSEDES